MKKKGNVFFPTSRKGWIKIVEAFLSILLITSVLLIVINKEYIGKKDISLKVYETEHSILREIQSDDELREEILNLENLPVGWEDNKYDDDFPLELIKLINKRAPNYLFCVGRICEIKDECVLDIELDEEIYAKSVTITATLGTYNPRQMKLFCWVGEAEEPVEPECEVGWKCKPDTVFLAYQNKNCDWSQEKCEIDCGADCEELRICYTGPAGTKDVGICHGGTETCTEICEFSGSCIGQQLPEIEGVAYGNCMDGLDNDCDGKVDTDPECF